MSDTTPEETVLVVEEVEVIEVTEEEAADAPKGPSLEQKISKKIENFFLIGLGAMATTNDEVKAAFEKFAERGEVMRQDQRAKVEEMRTKWQEKREEAKARMAPAAAAAPTVEVPVSDAPTKDDLASLTQTIAELTKKVEELSKAAGNA